MLILYDDPISGNGYKVWLLLAQLGIPYDLIELDILKQETRTPAFLRKNPNGRIPTIAFDDGRYLSESNEILFYFAQGTPYWPEDRYDQADVVRTIQPLTLCGRGAVPASFARSAGSRAVGRKT